MGSGDKIVSSSQAGAGKHCGPRLQCNQVEPRPPILPFLVHAALQICFCWMLIAKMEQSIKERVNYDNDLLALILMKPKLTMFPQKIVTNGSPNLAESTSHFCESYFISTMGGHNLRVLLAIIEGILPHVANIPRHKDSCFSL